MRKKTSRVVVRWINRKIGEYLPLVITKKFFGANFTPDGNIREVGGGRIFFRSGQLDAERLESLLLKGGVRTVVNLRGERSERHWYIEELETCKDLGVTHHDLRIPQMEPSREAILEYIGIIESDDNYPLLVHCTGGKDRSGLASAIYRMVKLGDEVREAMKELNPNASKGSTIRRFFEDYKSRGQDEGITFKEYVTRWDGRGYEYHEKKTLCRRIKDWLKNKG